MFSDRDQAKFEFMASIQQRIIQRKKSSTLNLVVLFSIFAALGYAGTGNVALTIVIGLVPTIIRAVGNQIMMEQLKTEHHRALCDFEGDLEELQTKLKTTNEVAKI